MIFKAYIELLKPRITFMVLVMTALGFILAGTEISWSLLSLTLFGTALSCGGAATLNHYLESDADALMKRTCNRPIPRGIIKPLEALSFGCILVLFGTILLAWKVNLLTGFLALLTAFLYVLVYTPLKKLTWLNTCIGAIPGALPPMGGWAAATGNLEAGAWVLFLILFVWQHPHFYSIAWMYKEEYRKAGFQMLPVIDDERGTRTFRQTLVLSVVLLFVSLLPWYIGLSSYFYLVGATAASLWFLHMAGVLFKERTAQAARKLLIATVLYLPALFALISFDKVLV